MADTILQTGRAYRHTVSGAVVIAEAVVVRDGGAAFVAARVWGETTRFDYPLVEFAAEWTADLPF